MSKRPSASFNDPGYFYSQRRLLKIFALSSVALMIGLLAMIWQDFDREWKDSQRAALVWEASRATLENMILQTMTVEKRAEMAAERKAAHDAIEARNEELTEIRNEIRGASGADYNARLLYNAQKQFTGQAEYRVNEARNDEDRAYWAQQLRKERDSEHRLRDDAQRTTERLNLLVNREKAIQKGLDDVIAKERANPKLKRMSLLAAAIAKKRGYNPLREIPLLDFLAPPTKVEQIVLDDLVDNYEFSMPKKVDRCGTCHIGAMRSGMEAETFPVEIVTDGYQGDRSKPFEEAVYRFTFSLMDAVWGEKVKPGVEYGAEKVKLRAKDIHHATLNVLFAEYDEESGEITVHEDGPKKNRKIWRRWTFDEETGEWKDDPDGVSIAEFYLGLLKGVKTEWRTHSHFDDMVGDASPHPYEKFGCTTCHLGRGWSVDFGFAYHTPDRLRIDNWMTDEWLDEHGHHAPENAKMTFQEAMKMGNAPGDEFATSVGWVLDHERGHEWEQNLGWTHEKTHHWHWPQHPKMLVQASCLKCHREGLYRTPAKEFGDLQLGKPDVNLPDVLDWEDHAASTSYDAEADAAGEYAGRIFIPQKKKPYRPENLERGMDNFLRFGCYGCHKLDSGAYPFMENVRPKLAPPLDEVGSKTTREFLHKWVRNPKDFRPGTRMPRFFGLSNNPAHHGLRFAKRGDKDVDGKAWQEAEVYAIVEWILDESAKRQRKFDDVDLSLGDAARGAKIVVADFQTSAGQAKACIACHDVPVPKAVQIDPALMKEWTDKTAKTSGGWAARMSRRQGPNLAGIGSKVDKNWLYAWLKKPRGYWHDTNMPNLRLSDQEALDVTAFLLTLKHTDFEKMIGVSQNDLVMKYVARELKVAEQQEKTQDAVNIVDAWTPREQTLYVGKKLVKHYGCFGCHQIDAYEDTTPIGTELTEWGSKLIERLEFNHAPIDKTRFDFAYTKLINPRIYDLGMSREDRPLERLKMPRFGLTPNEALDIATFLVGLVNDPVPEKSLFRPNQRQSEIIRGRQVIARFNCQGCHMIEGEGGDIWPVIGQVNWRPPDLLGQGAKTNPGWLFQFMKDPAFVLQYSPAGEDRVRPWHSIRMPTFEMTDEESRAIVKYFAALSREPSDFESAVVDGLGVKGEGYPRTFSLKDPTDKEGKRMVDKTVYSRLEEADAMFTEYACKSCHSNDPDVPMANRAPNFRHTLRGRLRDAWVVRWLWGPYKLQQGTKMPTYFGQDAPKPQDKRFFRADSAGATAEAQVRALRDFIRYHYKDE